MVIVDRDQFVSYCSGVLVDLHEGQGVIVNETQCAKAEEELLRGGVVLLTKNGELTGTHLVLKDGVCREAGLEVDTLKRMADEAEGKLK